MFSYQAIFDSLNYLARFINLMILVRVLFSWINPNPHGAIVQFIYAVTEPILSPVRHLIHNVLGYSGMLDFSPILAIFLVNFVHSIILRLIIAFL